MKTLILGMGNPILSDDGVGLLVADKLKGRVQGADVASSPLIGLNLFDQILGYETIFVIDAMTSTCGQIGEVKKLSKEDSFGTLHLFTSHGVNFFELLEIGMQFGYDMPQVGAVYGIEIGREVEFGVELTPKLSGKIDAITEEILTDMIKVKQENSGVKNVLQDRWSVV